MKNLFFIIVFVACFFQSNTQVTYNELPENNIEVANLHAVFENGYVITKYNSENKYFLSKDDGGTWNGISNGYNNILYNDDVYFNNVFGEIYKINTLTYKQELVFDESDFGFEDFAFLPDGSLIVLLDDKIKLYDSQFQFIKEHPIELPWPHEGFLLLGPNDKHFVYDDYDNVLLNFNSDLSTVSSFISTPKINSIQYSEERLFLSTTFSDDHGNNWQSYEGISNGSNQIIYAYNSRVLAIDGQSIYLSNDNGDTFEPYNLDSQYNDVTSGWLHSSNGISFIVQGRKIITTYDNGFTYDIQDLLYEKDEHHIAANENGYAITPKTRYDPNSNSWSSIDIGCFFKSMMVLSNSSFIMNPQLCISEDDGMTWTRDLDYNVGSNRQFVDKNEVLYAYYYKWLKSEDYGKTWQEFTYPNLPPVEPVFTVTGEGNIAMLNGNWGTIYFKDGQKKDVETNGLGIAEIVTAYTGPTTYFKLGDGFVFSLAVSFSGYDNLTEIDLPEINNNFNIKTDFLNNVYVYDNTRAYVSFNEGANWVNITPTNENLDEINNLVIGRDNHVYLATRGAGILKSPFTINGVKKINVIVFLDENEDCEFNESEESLWKGIKVTLNENQIKESINSGSISFRTLNDENTISIDNLEGVYNICPFDPIITFEEDDEKTIYIPLSISSECVEIEVNASTPLLRRCFDNKYYIQILNSGTITAENIQLDVILDDYFVFEACNFPILENDGKNIKIDLGQIDRFDKKRVHIDFNLSCEAELGQAHYIDANVVFDNSCSDNSVSETFECRQNIGAYDPNDKTALVEGIAKKEIVPADEFIEYLVRFQNTGTDTAFTVRIEDRLSDNFEMSTFKAVSSSHSYTYEIDRKNLTFVFQNILLPDSTVNEKDSHGFIKFKIKPKQSLDPGQLIQNNANIFFDFNDPILTNMTANNFLCKHKSVSIADTICQGEELYGYEESGTYIIDDSSFYGCDSITTFKLTVLDELDVICSPVATSEAHFSGSILIYPNPSSGEVYIRSENFKISKIKVFKVSGEKIANFIVDGNRIDLNLPDGLLMIQCISSTGEYILKKVVVNN